MSETVLAPEAGSWVRYARGAAFLEALAGGGAPRAVWTALPGPRWPDEIARAVAGLLVDDAGRRALGARALEWARRFAWPAVGRSVADLYADLLPAAGVAAGASRCHSLL